MPICKELLVSLMERLSEKFEFDFWLWLDFNTNDLQMKWKEEH